MNEKCTVRRAFVASGQVQGVGFRPFVYRLAHEGGLTGTVGNTSEGVRMEVQGLEQEVRRFGQRLRAELPPLARLTGLKEEDLPIVRQEDAFAIVQSSGHAGHSVLVSPDVGVCADCLADMADPQNPRYNYPFTNCTNCGPRYTITRSIPYDRAVTSMSCFPLCPRCAAEYANPADRRFHAQPVACPVCGPTLWFVSKEDAAAGRTCPQWASAQSGGLQAVRPQSASVQSGGVQPEGPQSALSQSGGVQSTSAQLARPQSVSPCSAGGSGSAPQQDCAQDKETLARLALERSGQVLLDGGILAIKGLGGFQLACDARNAQAVALLRQRKTRPHKPLALMAGDLAIVRSLCDLTPEHEALLVSPEKPIVLCPRRQQGEAPSLPPQVAPDTRQVGFMLPNTPLHSVLFDWLAARAPQPPVLVMTSANAGGEPICLGNREALERLPHLADAWLLHDRDILVRVDDSVITLQPHADPAAVAALPGASRSDRGEPLFYRRARGYVPRPVFLADNRATAGTEAAAAAVDAAATSADGPDPACVLGTGAELKATVCITRGQEAFVGQHVGDLENPSVMAFYEEVVTHLEKLLEVRPQALVCDLHPDFLSTRYAEARAAREGLPLWRLQHHAAHAAAVLAENACFSPALALCLDGTGLGDDGTVWGGELLVMDLGKPEWRRLGRLSPFALPGGDAAVREPWRIAQGLIIQSLATPTLKGQAAEYGHQDAASALAGAPWLPEHALASRAVGEMLARGINCPATSSCGRLFDAVAAQTGLCLTTTYEGQAAIRLEDAANRAQGPLGAVLAGRAPMADMRKIPGMIWPVGVTERDGLLELDSAGLFASVAQGLARGMPVAEAAGRFHLSLAEALAVMAGRAATSLGVTTVGLSGGVMQNAIMARLLPQALNHMGLKALTHHELPPGDGGLSLGQAVWGRRMLAAARSTAC
ncbi:carbamoyltransferase HypF [Desulfovibrio sp. 86]|uniref:acylphosphatase n=1 Tax=uncultured Desulfovibrio sp. TaxID=167968 RepID=A0A212L6C4_9BACT|nr:carbamoyltransferase HypF [Desulfovibrio sp. 86]SCM72889.1 (NiFe) hydrogenase maturation protein HypF [uncultured Desulfovibrio sp.]VZH33806.1 Acylphosphatase [Desulfovibrio sp. 86]